MFDHGRLLLRCTAAIADVYRKSADIYISEDAPRLASITGESPPYNNREYISRRRGCDIFLALILLLLNVTLGLFSSRCREYNTAPFTRGKQFRFLPSIFLSQSRISTTMKLYFATLTEDLTFDSTVAHE